MEITNTQTVAAARPRTLSPSPLTADWYTQLPVSTGMRDQSAVVSFLANHNSITRTASVAVPAVGFGLGAAKQGAPPRGVPR